MFAILCITSGRRSVHASALSYACPLRMACTNLAADHARHTEQDVTNVLRMSAQSSAWAHQAQVTWQGFMAALQYEPHKVAQKTRAPGLALCWPCCAAAGLRAYTTCLPQQLFAQLRHCAQNVAKLLHLPEVPTFAHIVELRCKLQGQNKRLHVGTSAATTSCTEVYQVTPSFRLPCCLGSKFAGRGCLQDTVLDTKWPV